MLYHSFTFSEKNFYTIVELPEGEHEYKFYIDGQWRHNPDEVSIPIALVLRLHISQVCGHY